ncbi:hypothetical protein [Sulfitobacter sp. JB4-11]|uniref:hypothetical protein n=1 Tax=Sulfitobacter rhodophyticola TaxID=3238304 RepID=UPI0035177B31
MITRIVRIDTETDIANLARALYRVEKGRGGENLIKRAEAALIAANPALRDEKTLVPGRRIIVPQIEGLALTTRVTDSGEAIGAPAAEALGRLSQIAMSLELGEETAQLRRERLLEQARSDEMKAIVESDLEGGSDLLEKALEATARQYETDKRQIHDLRAAIDAARGAFDAIAQRGDARPKRQRDYRRR